MDELHEKLKALKENLEEMGRVAVAFSYGVDSTFLLKTAHEVLGDNVIAITARSVVLPKIEAEEGTEFCKAEGIRQLMVDYDILADKTVRTNPIDRCYYCKRRLMESFLKLAESEGFTILIEGSNLDDESDYRPGMKALKELGVLSPLKEAGLTKQDIRLLSKEMDLPTWDKPSMACLATRIPYDEELTIEKLHKIELAENILQKYGFGWRRVRMHGNLARIELGKKEIPKMLDPEIAEAVAYEIKELGFEFVTLDLKGRNL